MVQFVFTPWRNRAELLLVRQQLFPVSSFSNPLPSTPPEPWWANPTELRDIERAIARIFMWVHRGGCPHVVESTALLMAAIVFDARGPHDAIAQAAVVSGYLVGFTRFVTGLLDSHQDKARKLSMYGVAKTIGLPASFVELRHQGTHESMPSLTQLRPAARRALVWIWEYYWRNLPEENEGVGEDAGVLGETKDVQSGPRRSKEDGAAGPPKNSLEQRMCRSALLGFLQRQEGEVGEAATEGLMRQLKKWDWGLVITTLADIGESTRDSGMLLRSVKLTRTILGTADEDREGQDEGETALRQELTAARDEAEKAGEGSQRLGWGRVTGKRKKDEVEDGDQERKRGAWFKPKGPWVAKPIGVL
ncbi:rRNA-processing protein las1 [Gnomoniopsis smithogilvyi]|uniref:rRNA-processing protein las1 n=1 Tax=Gnomoniopsis smithogilvyi TaxID=1191159 RepID=A0A9W9CU97_9PEZI|nr:rRNA-processing protein las1 [Gnomoniopsis smithogilvyi]